MEWLNETQCFTTFMGSGSTFFILPPPELLPVLGPWEWWPTHNNGYTVPSKHALSNIQTQDLQVSVHFNLTHAQSHSAATAGGGHLLQIKLNKISLILKNDPTFNFKKDFVVTLIENHQIIHLFNIIVNIQKNLSQEK